MLARRIAPWALFGLTIVIVAIVIALQAMTGARPEAGWGDYVFPLAVVMSGVTGVVLATRRRENPIGWLLLANGLILASSGVAETWAAYALLDHPGTAGGALAAAVNENIWPLLFAPFAAIAFILP
ncbi:MAG: hypothetical protein WKF48_12950 [Solirubrobacteraceae bacterium]